MRRPAWLNYSQAHVLFDLFMDISNCTSICGHFKDDATNPKQNFLVWKLSKLSKAIKQIHATKVFTYGGLRAEHWAAGDHGLSQYS